MQTLVGKHLSGSQMHILIRDVPLRDMKDDLASCYVMRRGGGRGTPELPVLFCRNDIHNILLDTKHFRKTPKMCLNTVFTFVMHLDVECIWSSLSRENVLIRLFTGCYY